MVVFQLRTSGVLSGVVSSLGIDSRASFKDQAYVLTMGIPITVVFFSTHSVTLMECHNMFVVGYNLSLNSEFGAKFGVGYGIWGWMRNLWLNMEFGAEC